MKAILLIIMFSAFTANAQKLNGHYLKDTFDLNQHYLFEYAKGWIEQHAQYFSIHFIARDRPNDHFSLHNWIKSGRYEAPLKVHSDSTFSFTVNWKNDKGDEFACDYTGLLITNYLNKRIRFKTECEHEVNYPAVDQMTGGDAWPGFLPPEYGSISGKVLQTDVINMEINEPSLVMQLLTDAGDTVNCDIFFSDDLGKPIDYDDSYFVGKTIEMVYYFEYSDESYYSGSKMIVKEE